MAVYRSTADSVSRTALSRALTTQLSWKAPSAWITHIFEHNPRLAPERKEPREAPCPLCGTAQIVYGIESYFVPEGEGREIEKIRDRKALTVDIALADDGEAAIKSLRMNGTTIYDEPLF